MSTCTGVWEFAFHVVRKEEVASRDSAGEVAECLGKLGAQVWCGEMGCKVQVPDYPRMDVSLILCTESGRSPLPHPTLGTSGPGAHVGWPFGHVWLLEGVTPHFCSVVWVCSQLP